MPTIARQSSGALHQPLSASDQPPWLRKAPPWAFGLALAIPLCIAYLIVSPPSADLAAATYRSHVFSAVGFAIWDNGWYAGHALPSYSLLSPEFGAWLGLRHLLALSALAGACIYGLIATRLMPRSAALASTLAFAFGFCTELPSGRVPYDLGAAIGLLAVLAFMAGPLALALLLAVVSSVASPVAGAFLALGGLAYAGAVLLPPPGGTPSPGGGSLLGALRDRAVRSQALRGLSLCAVSLSPILLLSAMFPEGGVEPFAPGAFWPELAAGLAFAALLPQGPFSRTAWIALRLGGALYVLSLIASFLIPTPVGGNVVRLGALFGPPLALAGAWGWWRSGRRPVRIALLAAAAPLLLYWQLATSIDDQVALANDPTVQASFYEPLRSELLKLADRRPIRVEVPLTGAHWESAYLPGGPISIARGWDRQLDVRYGAFFYGESYAGATRISPAAYRKWLSVNGISYVALPRARLDSAGRAEARLVERGTPYLRLVWRSARWRLYEVRDATPLVQSPATAISIGIQSFSLRAPRRGSYLVRLHWTPYWAPLTRGVCVSPGPRGLTKVTTTAGGVVHVEAQFSLARLLEGGSACST